jgi:phosphopantetheine--protein transferase-like protein
MNGASSAAESSQQMVKATIWMAQLHCIEPETLQLYRSWLTASELEQHARFLSGRRCREFVAGRGLSRVALSQYCRCLPDELQFDSDAKGKLSVIAPVSACGVHFNLSHTADLIVCGVCPERAIGLDVERIGSRLDPLEIARRFFSACETVALEHLPPADRPGYFCTLWTLKEALAKAHGLGLSAPLHSTSFFVSNDDHVDIVLHEPCFSSDAWLAVAAPTPMHRLAVAVLCESTAVVEVTTRWHHMPPDAANGERLHWAQGRLSVQPDEPGPR